MELHEVRPLHEGRPTALTRAGRLSLRATAADGRAVRLTELHGPAHAELVATLSRTDLADVLPPVLAVSGSVVVTAWMPSAQDATPLTAIELARLLARIHATPVPDVPAGFDYFTDFLVPRARRAALTLDGGARLDHALAAAARPPDTSPLRVTHPDLTPDNVLRTDGGGLVIIDNELLGVGRTPLLDLCNLARGVDRTERGVALDVYLAERGITLDAASLSRLRAMWFVRMAGAFHIAGRLHDVERLIEDGPQHLRLPFETS
jgi:hypothetical protein